MIHNQQHDISVVAIVSELLEKAISMSASDIHLEPTEYQLRVRFRLDGMLHDQPALTKNNAQQIISRLKVLSSINIAEKRIPQDGKFHITYKNKSIDLR